MRIGLIYPHWTLAQPGAPLSDALSILGHEFARRLATRCEVVVYAGRQRGQAREEASGGIALRRISLGFDRALNSLKLLDRLQLRRPTRPFRSSRLYYPWFARSVARDLKRRGCQIAHVFGIPVFIPTLRAVCPEIKILLHMHDDSLAQRDRELTLAQAGAADRIVTVSDFVTDRVRERFPELADRCRTLHNGVDIERFSPAGNESPARRVLFVGRISPEKGVHVLLEALPDLVRMRPDLEVTLAGPRRVAPREFVDPSDEDLLLRELQPHYEKPADYFASLDRLPHAVAGRISFLGAVPHAQLAECYRRADVFVFPSVWHEPFGMPVIEAMACGLPVVATRGGAFPEIVDDGRTGLLVPRGNAAALASAIGKLLSDPAVAAKMGRCGRSRVCERFAWDRIAEQLVGLYRELLA